MSQTIILKHSTVKDKLPSSAQYGEVFVNYHSENPFLATLNNQGQFEKFLSETKTRGLIQDAKEDIDNSFYTKAETNTLLEGKANSAHTHDYSQILNTPDLSNFATLSDIPSINGLASEVWVGENYQPKGNYLTEHQSLENYYTKSEADGKFLTSHQDLSGYALKSDLDDYLTIASASTTYATKSEIPDISDLATKSEIPDTSGFATKQELEDYQMKSGMTSYLLASEAQETYQPKGTYVVPSDLNNYITSGYAEETFAKKGDVPTDVYTKSETDNLLAGKANSAHTHSYTALTDLPDLSIYLTEHQDISGLATKQELENYMPNSGMTDYALKSEIPNSYTKTETDVLLAGKANSAHTHTMSEITDLDIPKTWRGTLAQYNNLTEIDNDTLYIITDSSEQLVTSGDVESMISGYTNLTEVETLLEGYSQTGHTHSQYAEKADLANYQPQSGMTDYLTVSSASTMFATKEELAEFTPSAGYVQNIWVGSLSDYENLTIVDSNTLYCITDEQEQLVTRSYAMNTFATKAMMSDYLTVSAATEMFVEKEAEPLPAYQFVDYIDVSGNTPGIITDYYLTANSVIEFDSEPALANDNMTLYGVTDADWGGMTEGMYAKYGYNLYTYHGYGAESVVQDVSSGRHTFKAGYNYGGEAKAGCQVDDGEIQTCLENYQSWGGQNNLPLGLFGIWSIDYDWNNNLGMKFNGKFYGCKVYEGNTLMRDYVPCVETSTGKVGIFDTLNDSFYETTASASTTVTGSSSAVTATTEETTSGETSGSTSGETSGETTGQTAYTIDTSVYEVGDYIDLNRDTYDLNYLINGDSKFVLDIYLQAGQNYEEMFGIESGDCFKIGTGDSEGSVGLIFGNYQTRNTQYYIENDGRYVFEMSSGGTVVNGSMVADWSQAGTVYGMTNSHCHLGGLWQVMVEDWGDGPMDMSSLRGEPYFRMYNFKIYEGNTLLRDYRPVKRLSDDAIGWFDVVNQTFMGRDENNSFGEGASLGYNE